MYETVIAQAQHLFVYGIAFLLTGLPVAKGVDKLLANIQWGRIAPPPEPPPPIEPDPQEP